LAEVDIDGSWIAIAARAALLSSSAELHHVDPRSHATGWQRESVANQ